ncbi:ThiF family adenylyltransferase [Oceanihabitans sediminis]|uniref:ThiF family adenylyltransferase n=1 Tax=Oceanihabitans sediminis TaxID=1812012 RepID=UPI00299D40B6|nr:ThiF family adenylyltransferase [Oceanihabitans sediminis]MDX1279242.1 ThiF family adenylyltransferase [Oceanihabitans sediminis]
MADELNLSRQAILVPKDNIDQWNIEVFGVGSVGSHVVKCLAKTGFENIKVYDMDIVESENIAAQAFDFKHIKMNKVDAMKDIVKESTGIEIETEHGTITEETEITPEPNTIYCCFFDSLEARKLVFNKLKDFPVVFVDARIGKYNLRHYLVELEEATYKESYEKTLETTTLSELACGEKACAPINLQLAGLIVMNIVNFIKGTDYSRTYIANAEATLRPINVIVRREKESEEVVQSDAASTGDENDT